jgi:hypothetical protein
VRDRADYRHYRYRDLGFGEVVHPNGYARLGVLSTGAPIGVRRAIARVSTLTARVLTR